MKTSTGLGTGRWFSLLVPLLAAGCTCGAFDPTVTRFACSTNADCGEGFVCGQVAGSLECVTDGAGDGGASTGGGVAGGGTGVTGGGTGVTGGGTGVTGGGTGGGSGPADRLAFTTSPQTISTSTCSGALTVQTRNSFDQPTPVAADTVVDFSTPGTGVTFSLDSLCTFMTSNAAVPAGMSTTTVFFRATQAGSFSITASAPPLMPATQLQVVQAPPDSLAFLPFPIPPGGFPAGTCLPATLETRRSGTATSVRSDAPVSLQSSLSGGLRFYSDTGCTSSVTGLTIPAGQSQQTFSLKTISGGTNGVVATASFGTANLAFPVQAVVRRGVCLFGPNQSLVTCPISPPQLNIAKTVVTYQAVSSSNEPNDSQIRCRLVQTDSLTCERFSGNIPATVSWQTAELGTGLSVQRRFAPACFTGNPPVPLTTGVNPATSFVLSSFTGDGFNFDADDLLAARLQPDGGSVLLDNRSTAPCDGFEFQVVELSGVSVTRGSGSLGLGQRQMSLPFLAPASANAVVFNQAVLAGNPPTTTSMCNFMVRSELTGPSTVLFSRGGSMGPAGCATVAITEVPFERVDFGSRARVQTFTRVLSNNSVDVPILAVDSTRTLVFASGQMAGGQASGETSSDNNGDDSIGVGMARFDLLSDTMVRVTRGRTQGTATVTFFLVELEP